MLKEMISMIAFMLALTGIIGSIVFTQKVSERQKAQITSVMESANEIN